MTTKERPILFSGAMVRAILEGRKTVTRRVVKPVPYGDLKWNQQILGKHVTNWTDDLRLYECPYGQPGDRLWVRETWCGPVVDTDELEAKRADGWAQFRKPEYCQYRASGGCNEYFDESRDETVARWRPSIHMPRWASRILLEITAVRVERLQDITRSDIRAEGLVCPPELRSDDVSPNYRDWYPAAWRELWESINGPDSWTANPWVWVVEFKRVTP